MLKTDDYEALPPGDRPGELLHIRLYSAGGLRCGGNAARLQTTTGKRLCFLKNNRFFIVSCNCNVTRSGYHWDIRRRKRAEIGEETAVKNRMVVFAVILIVVLAAALSISVFAVSTVEPAVTALLSANMTPAPVPQSAPQADPEPAAVPLAALVPLGA